MNRRTFFERSGRWVSAGLLALLAGYLAREREIAPPAACRENPFCGQCRKFGSCEKPQAMEYKSSTEEE